MRLEHERSRRVFPHRSPGKRSPAPSRACSTASTDDHIWTVAELDGTTYHIDTTWGDMTTGGIDYKYFAMSEKEALGRF